MADVRHTLLEAARALERAGVPDPRLDAEWLLAHVLGMDRLAMRMSGTAQLTPQQEQRMASLLLSRTRRTPLHSRRRRRTWSRVGYPSTVPRKARSQPRSWRAYSSRA